MIIHHIQCKIEIGNCATMLNMSNEKRDVIAKLVWKNIIPLVHLAGSSQKCLDINILLDQFDIFCFQKLYKNQWTENELL